MWKLAVLSMVIAEKATCCEKTPLELLQERYARGDIDQEEYEQNESVLQGRPEFFIPEGLWRHIVEYTCLAYGSKHRERLQ